MWQHRAHQLILMIQDVDASTRHPLILSPGATVGSRHHNMLFEDYVKEISQAKKWTEEWWQALIHTEMQRTPDREFALEKVRRRWPLGPAPTKRIITVIRKYWLASDRLNQQVVLSERVAPVIFILKWLMERGHDDLAEFLTGYPYWPVGLDEDGNWS
jgi:hypothetical protein